MIETLQDFLKRMHMEEYPNLLDDELPDAYDDWIAEQDVEVVIAYAEKWHAEQKLAELNGDIKRRKNARKDSRLVNFN